MNPEYFQILPDEIDKSVEIPTNLGFSIIADLNNNKELVGIEIVYEETND